MNDAERTIEFFSSVVKPTGKILTEEEKQSREYLIQYLLPTVLPALNSLLKAEEENKGKEKRGQDVLPIQPLDYIAKYLYRHNPKHTQTTGLSVETLEALSQQFLASSRIEN